MSDELESDFLPSPRQAMRQAFERAQLGEFEAARLWLDLARELRVGSMPARPFPRSLDTRSELAAEADLATAGLMPAPDPAPDETAVLRYDPPGEATPNRCAYCGHEIGLVLSPGTEPHIWRHLLTKQAVCPVSRPDQQHTFATPSVDARG